MQDMYPFKYTASEAPTGASASTAATGSSIASGAFRAWDSWQNRMMKPQVNAIVKNSFVHVVDAEEAESQKSQSLRRSSSDGDLSRSSGSGRAGSEKEQVVGYFLPSLWSSSNSSARGRDSGHNLDTAPWVMSHPGGAVSSMQVASAHSREQLSLLTSQERQALAQGQTALQGSQRNMKQPFAPSQMRHKAPPEAQANGYACQPQQSAHAEEECTVIVDESLASLDKDTLIAEIYAEMKGRVKMDKLEELAMADVLARIPRNENFELSSVGSIGHGTGDCTPCAYWFKRICKYSISCHYCHFSHNGQKSKRLRPSKQTRMRIRRWEAQKAAEGGLCDDTCSNGRDDQPDENGIESL